MKKTAILFGAALLAASFSVPVAVQCARAGGNKGEVNLVTAGGKASLTITGVNPSNGVIQAFGKVVPPQ